MAAYYNEIEPFAAEWLRQLIKHGHIAPGDVDTRSIEDVTPEDLRGYTQCHFFAGIGVWSYALRLAGWPDDKPVLTGSCPCQPFSSAGKGAGFDDEWHLWPSFYWLIEQCQPPVIFGEQVASKDAEPWIDLVQADMEAMDYAFGCVPFPSAGIGAPHIRDRAYWVANSEQHGDSAQEQTSNNRKQKTNRPSDRAGRRGISLSWLGDTERTGLERLSWGHQSEDGRKTPIRPSEQTSAAGGLADNELQQRPLTAGSSNDAAGRQQKPAEIAGLCSNNRPMPTNGFWRNADWLGCRDGKWRPVEPGTFPLVNGSANRVGRLRGYGNAINAEAAKAFIQAFGEINENF